MGSWSYFLLCWFFPRYESESEKLGVRCAADVVRQNSVVFLLMLKNLDALVKNTRILDVTAPYICKTISLSYFLISNFSS